MYTNHYYQKYVFMTIEIKDPSLKKTWIFSSFHLIEIYSQQKSEFLKVIISFDGENIATFSYPLSFIIQLFVHSQAKSLFKALKLF